MFKEVGSIGNFAMPEVRGMMEEGKITHLLLILIYLQALN